MAETPKSPSRRGTEVRQRSHQIGVRLLPEELAKVQELAARDGVSPAEVMRRALLSTPN